MLIKNHINSEAGNADSIFSVPPAIPVDEETLEPIE